MLSKVAFAITTALGYLTVQNTGSYVDLAANDPGAISALEVQTHSAKDHTAASWSWTNEGDIIGTRAFRYVHITPVGKFARFALCELAADNGFTFYHNNLGITAQNHPNDWSKAKRFFLNLLERANVLAVTVTNTAGSAAFVAACRVVYSDGSVDTILTDTTWHTFPGPVPPYCTTTSFVESSSWVNATNRGAYGVSPWGNSVAWLPLARPVDFTPESKWIWTAELNSGGLPVSSRPFRYAFTIPYTSSKSPKYFTAMIAVEDEFALYVNGEWVGSGSDRTVGYRYIVPAPGWSLVIAIVAHNKVANSNAGVIGTFQVIYSDGSWDTINTNASTFKTVASTPPSGFQLPGFDDSAWSAATVVSSYEGNNTVVTPPL